MKTFICFVLVLLYCTTASSQKKIFIRLFDNAGQKFARGHIQHVTDSSIVIMVNGKKTMEIPVKEITQLKLRRSFGHTLLITTLVVGATGAVMGAATADPDAWLLGYSVAEGIVAGLAVGAVAGVVTGSIISGTRNRPVFQIDRNTENWNRVKEVLRQYAPATSQAQFAVKNI